MKEDQKEVQDLIDDFVRMNKEGLVLELCEKYYDENVTMLNNGILFADSMRESYEKQKGFVESVTKFDVNLVSKAVHENVAQLVFHYKMTGSDSEENVFTGKHVQTWNSGKIVREEYFSISLSI